ncbi:MAG: hypothetical protein WDN28_19685 [Chthoniobacter sp.]
MLLPIWRTEFAIGYAMLALLRGLYAGVMAALQLPTGRLAEKFGGRLVLVGGTLLAALAADRGCASSFARRAPAGGWNSMIANSKTNSASTTTKAGSSSAGIINVTLVSIAFAFLRREQLRAKKTSGVTLPRARRLLQARLIRLTGRCPWCQTRFTIHLELKGTSGKVALEFWEETGVVGGGFSRSKRLVDQARRSTTTAPLVLELAPGLL